MYSSLCRVTSARCLPSLARTMDAHQSKPELVPSMVRVMSSMSDGEPFAYSSGRWLHRDRLELDSRYVKFNFSQLCNKVVAASQGAKEVVKWEKKEGSFNCVFIMTMDTGRKVVARVPFPIAGPPRLTTNSEVATITYLQEQTLIPIPKILDWSDDPSNPVGCEFILMDHVEGVRLHERWRTMDSKQRMMCVKALGIISAEMINLKFPAYGSIYFASSPVDPSLIINIGDGYSIGPHCGQVYWNSACGERELYKTISPNHRPWSTLPEYCQGLIDTGKSRLPDSDPKPPPLDHQGTIADHIKLLDQGESIIQKLLQLPSVQVAAEPTLFHYDFHKHNIYVAIDNPTKITGIIDWQCTNVEPGFVYANEFPDFAAPYDFANPQIDEKEPKLALTREEEKEKTSARICNETFEAIIRIKGKKLGRGRALDDNLVRPFAYIATSWRDSAAAIRQELLEVSEKWEELGLEGVSPFKLTTQELEAHRKQYEDFESAQRLKLWLTGMLRTNSDGFVPNEAWKPAKEANKEAYEEWLDSASRAGDMGEEKAAALWPFHEF